jgi:hypothetical protein
VFFRIIFLIVGGAVACGGAEFGGSSPDAAAPDAGAAVGGAGGVSTGSGSSTAGGTAGIGGSGTAGNGGAGGSDDAGSDASSTNDGGACPSLVDNPCWRSYLAEYAAIATCFAHRNKCDASGTSGDASECGKWTDGTKSVCLWPDGTEVDRMAGLNIVKSPAKVECYRREYTQASATFTFSGRKYVFSSTDTPQWTMTCPDGSTSRVVGREVTSCAPPGICCSTMSPPLCEPFPFF